MTKEQFENLAMKLMLEDKEVLISSVITFSQIAINAIGKIDFQIEADLWGARLKEWGIEHFPPPVNKPVKS